MEEIDCKNESNTLILIDMMKEIEPDGGGVERKREVRVLFTNR